MGGCVVLFGTAANKVAEENKLEVQRIKQAPIEDIAWSEVNDIYNLKSKYTDLLKDELWKSYKGKKVKWSGEVSSVSETFGTLQVQIKMNSSTFVSDVILGLKDDQKSKAINLKEGDSITYVGTLDRWGTLMPISMGNGEIK
jgi:hypothetical protein